MWYKLVQGRLYYFSDKLLFKLRHTYEPDEL